MKIIEKIINFKKPKTDTNEKYSKVIWTGPSVRVKDVGQLLNSKRMNEDIMAVKVLRDHGIVK